MKLTDAERVSVRRWAVEQAREQLMAESVTKQMEPLPVLLATARALEVWILEKDIDRKQLLTALNSDPVSTAALYKEAAVAAH